MSEKSRKILSVDKAILLLNCLADARGPLSLRELSERTGWAKSTIHGLISSMYDHGIIEQSKTDGKYRLGVRLFELGSIVSTSWNIDYVARPYLQNLSLQTGETALIGMLDRNEVLCVEHIDTNLSLRVAAHSGMRFPLHCSALGKAMLAYMDNWKGALALHGLPSFTPHTITTMEGMQTELKDIRQKGYAIENGEMRIGLRAVAAPIFDVYGMPQYAIGVTGMMRSTSDEIFILAKRLVVEAAQAISFEFGHRAS